MRELLQKEGVDIIVVTSRHNLYYLTQASLDCIVVISQQYPTPTLIMPLIEGMAPKPSGIHDVRFFGDFYVDFSEPLTPQEALIERAYKDYYSKGVKDAASAVVGYLVDENLSTDVIGIEKRDMSIMMKEALEKSFPNAQFKDVTNVLRSMRAIKTPKEIKKLKKVAEVNEKALESAIGEIRAGASEKELAEIYVSEVIRKKAEPLLYHVNAGRFSSYSLRYASEKKIRKGEVVRFDVVCRLDGYCADLSRTKVLGSPSQKSRRVWNAVSKGGRLTLESLKPGLPVKEIFKNAMSIVVREGIPNYRRSNVGHGIGVEMHELPILGPHSIGSLQKNMVLNVETPYYCIGLGGFAIEDTVVITDDGVESLTQLDRSFCV